MTLLDAIYSRHSVRRYLDKQIEDEKLNLIRDYINELNKESNLHLQLVTNEPNAFESKMAHYGDFRNVKNYIAVIGKKDKDLEEKCGYYGQKLVLYIQTLGLNTCWVALSYQKVKTAYTVDNDEKLLMVISLGYGENQGKEHKNKELKYLCKYSDDDPSWYRQGVKCALLAPTALNQQSFFIKRNDNIVSIKAKVGVLTKIDLGIVKCNFEIGAGKENFNWK